MNFRSMKKLAAKGKMSRRDFVQLAIAAGVTAVAAETMFVKAVLAEPKKGGRFRMAVGSGATTDTLDPATFPDTSVVSGVGPRCVRASLKSTMTARSAAIWQRPSKPQTAPRSGCSTSARASNSITASR